MEFSICSYLLIFIAGWKIPAANSNVYLRFCYSIYQGMETYSCHVIFYPSSCPLWCTHVYLYIKACIPWTNYLFTCSNCGRADNWFNQNCMQNLQKYDILFVRFGKMIMMLLSSMFYRLHRLMERNRL